MTRTAKFEVDALTTTGTTDWMEVGKKQPKSLELLVTTDTPNGVSLKVEYSEDGTNVVSESLLLTGITDADDYVFSIPAVATYPYVRLNWTAGTATSIDVQGRAVILGS